MHVPDQTTNSSEATVFEPHELEQIDILNGKLISAWLPEGSDEDQKSALRCYLRTMSLLHRRYRMFEMANHRFFTTGGSLLIPYDAHGYLVIYTVENGSSCVTVRKRLPHGTLITDELVFDLAKQRGEVIDLEREIYHVEIDDMPAVQVARLRDLASLLQRLNSSGRRHEAVYLLRFLVARLCSNPNRGVPGAKNLQPEALSVRNELIEFLNGPFASRLRLPTRILVRSISSLVSQPKLIDEVWQDTIDLCEVHVRGSSITNEIRRSTHHAMGRQTLALSKAYLQWIETGEAAFPHPEREIPAEADQLARQNPEIRKLVQRIVSDLEQLLGSSQIATRIEEWRVAYAGELMRCESGNSLDEELESLLVNGIEANNRWVYQHRLRSMAGKAADGQWADGVRDVFTARLQALQETLPGEDAFEAGQAGQAARLAVKEFSDSLRNDHQDAVFTALEELLVCYKGGRQFRAFELSCSLRKKLEELAGNGVFTSQRYLLHHLDCILEELGYFALRHVASGYLEDGVELTQCLRIVYLCAGNLEQDGLFSRELWDLSAMLIKSGCTASELMDVLGQIQRNYLRLVFRVCEAYEVMAGHLGYNEDEMRAVLGNFQRTMHDLNSLVHFSDIARSYLSDHGSELPDLGSGALGENPWDFVHLSHADDIATRIENWTAPSLQAKYGGKGCGLIHIAWLGIPTRDAFIIPTVLPRMKLNKTDPERLDRELIRHVRTLEQDIADNEGTSLHLGDPVAPLLLAVRGGSVFSMPGMLSTIVYTGMTRQVAEALAVEDEWHAWDSYRRFLASYAAAVWRLDLEELDLVEKAKRRHGLNLKIDLPGHAMREIVEDSKQAIRNAGHGAELDAILDNAELQLKNAVRAVHASWDGERARRYREIKHLSEGWQTAVIVQQMASGNHSDGEELSAGMDETRISLTGVIPHTRMTTSGFRVFTGDVKFNACGDDLVGGLTAARSFEPVQELHSQAPMLGRKLNHISARLRRFLGSDAEIEFTVERGVLSILQTRSAQMELHHSARTFKDGEAATGRGIGVSGGAFRGLVAFNEDDVKSLAGALKASEADVDGILLVLENPIPDEIPLILSVDGLLAARGGSTSHAAVAVHGIDDRPFAAVLGVAELQVFRDEAVLVGSTGENTHTIKAGDILSIHGRTGDVFIGSREILTVQ